MAQQTPGPVNSAGPQAPARTRLSAGLVSALLGGGLLVAFMVQNREDVTIDLLFWDFTWPLWLFTLLTAALGAFVWLGLGVLRRHRRRVARRADRAA